MKVGRAVSLTERDGLPAEAVELVGRFAADSATLWEAVTNPDRLARWFAPVHIEPGDRFRIEGNASGRVLACEPPSHLSLTWEFGGDASWVEIRIADGELALTHASRRSEHGEKFGPGATGVGWELAFLGLDRHLAGVPRLDEAAFAGSEEGRAFLRASSEAWGRAAIDAGAEPEKALAAAARTAGFYVGESSD